MRVFLHILTFIFILSCSNNDQATYDDFKNEIKSQKIQNKQIESQIGTNSDADSKSNINSSNHELDKIDCTNKLEAYILAAEKVSQEGIDLITKWVCVSERLFFDSESTNWEIVNPIYITALNRHDIESAIDLEKVWCDHIKKYHNSGKGNDGYDNGKCNPKHYQPEKEGCNFGLCLFTEPNGKVAGSSISSNRKHDGFNLFISNSHDLPMHADSYGYVTIHEMFHIYQYSNLTKTRSRDDEMRMVGKLGTGSNPKDEVPWWIEGNAVFFGYYKYAKEIQDREYFINKMENAMWGKWDGILIEKYLNSEKTINEFTWTGEEKKIGYELGAWFVAFLINQVGEEKIYEFWKNLEFQGNFNKAFKKYFGKEYEIYVDEFDEFLRKPNFEILGLLDKIYPDPKESKFSPPNSKDTNSRVKKTKDSSVEKVKALIINEPNLEEHYFKLENNIPKDYFAQEIITSTDVPLTHKDQYYEIQNNLNSIIGSYQKYIMFITTTNEFSQPVFDRLKEVGWEHPLEINIADNGKPYLNRAGCLTGAGHHPSDGSLPDPYSLCIMDYEFIEYPHETKEWGSPLSKRQAVIYHGWAHEYFHHYQRSHSFERSMGMEGDCCGGNNHINSPAWWIEGAAGIFPNLWLRYYWKEFSEFENLNYKDVNVEMMNLDHYYIESKKEMQGLRRSSDPNRKACTEFTDKEEYRETGYCNWSIFNAYVAYISSYQALWVGIPRDYHELGFDESFKKHVGITKEEAYENYKTFMNSEDPNSPAPVGFFPEGPITDYADFLIINSPQEIYDSRLEELKKNQFSLND